MTTTTVLEPPGILLPRCSGGDPVAFCTCRGSLLTYMLGGYVHVDRCTNCLGAGPCPTPERHRACSAPERVCCPHGACDVPADPNVTVCALGLRGGCSGCCWITGVEVDW